MRLLLDTHFAVGGGRIGTVAGWRAGAHGSMILLTSDSVVARYPGLIELI